MSDKYILDKDGKPQHVSDLLEWARAFETMDRQIANTIIDNRVRVSTVFLGIDHAYNPDSDPILFETMVFGGKEDGFQDRYSTKEEAIAGHKEVVERLMGFWTKQRLETVLEFMYKYKIKPFRSKLSLKLDLINNK